MADKYHDTVAKSSITVDDSAVAAETAKILEKAGDKHNTPDILKFLFSCVELTSLRSTDSQQSISALVDKVNLFESEHGDLPNVAAICVYPNFAQTVRAVLEVSEVEIACVAGGFPSSQTFPEIKVAETALAVASGADEIDTVINIGDFLDDDWESVTDELGEIKNSCRDHALKVILETGALQTAARVRAAAILSLYSGADFIKTSTGKGYPGATPEAVYVMCKCIKEYFGATGRMAGIKVAGGVSTVADALRYYAVVSAVLGEKWLTPEYFRIGSSNLANELYKAITGKTENFF